MSLKRLLNNRGIKKIRTHPDPGFFLCWPGQRPRAYARQQRYWKNPVYRSGEYSFSLRKTPGWPANIHEGKLQLVNVMLLETRSSSFLKRNVSIGIYPLGLFELLIITLNPADWFRNNFSLKESHAPSGLKHITGTTYDKQILWTRDSSETSVSLWTSGPKESCCLSLDVVSRSWGRGCDSLCSTG